MGLFRILFPSDDLNVCCIKTRKETTDGGGEAIIYTAYPSTSTLPLKIGRGKKGIIFSTMQRWKRGKREDGCTRNQTELAS